MVAPIALFYARFDGVLIPLAIQLYQKASPTNPVSMNGLKIIFFVLNLEKLQDQGFSPIGQRSDQINDRPLRYDI